MGKTSPSSFGSSQQPYSMKKHLKETSWLDLISTRLIIFTREKFIFKRGEKRITVNKSNIFQIKKEIEK